MIRIAVALALMCTPALAAPGFRPAAPLRTEPAIELKDGRYELSTDTGGFALGYDNKFREIERTGLDVRVKDTLMSTPALAAPGFRPAAPLRTEPAIELKGGRYELSTDTGGFARNYDIKFMEIERTEREVRVRDICASACTMVLRNPRACAERAALFGFHQALTKTGDNYEYSERGTRILWSYYPETVRAKLGELKPEMVWIKGTDLLPECK